MSKPPISRRTMLRGLGVAMGLPLLDAMLPGGLIGAAEAMGAGIAPNAARAGAGAIAGKAVAAPVRMAMLFVPNGVCISDWTPTTEGAGYALSKTLAPLAKVKNDITVLTGLALDNGRAKGDGPGDHARGAATFLTGAHPFKTKGKDIKLGISVDQRAAQEIGSRTRLPSLELGLDKGQTVGDCDSGYSCAYVTNIAWRNETTPVPKEVDPGALFDRLFGNGGGPGEDPAVREANAKRLRGQRSVLDFVSEDAKRLQRQVGRADQQKMDEFTTSIREIEKRVDAARAEIARTPIPIKIDMERPNGVPGELSEHMKLMTDLMVLAFRMDITRISTLMVARDGSNRTYREIGVTEGHHTLSHHGKDPGKMDQIRKIDLLHMEQFAYFIEKLKAAPEGAGSVLDNTMVMYGSGLSDGDRHNHNDLPILLAGKGGGLIKPGRHIRYPKDTPLCNLYVAMLNKMGVKTTSFSDSNGSLPGLG